MHRSGPEPPPGIVVIVPTYNEANSIAGILATLRRIVPGATLLVVDDASPDGTGAIVDRLAAADDHIRILHRPGRQGLGAAYRAGMQYALDAGAAVVVQLDADGSHPVEELPAMLAALEGPGVGLVIGSRYVPGGAVTGWSRHRHWLSRVANRYARWWLRLSVRDVTAGYRVWRASVLRQSQALTSPARGYGFQVDLTRRAARHTAIAELPIEFVERQHGRSKMTFGIALEAWWLITGWGIAARLRGTDAPRPEHDGQ